MKKIILGLAILMSLPALAVNSKESIIKRSEKLSKYGGMHFYETYEGTSWKMSSAVCTGNGKNLKNDSDSSVITFEDFALVVQDTNANKDVASTYLEIWDGSDEISSRDYEMRSLTLSFSGMKGDSVLDYSGNKFFYGTVMKLWISKNTEGARSMSFIVQQDYPEHDELCPLNSLKILTYTEI